MSYVEAYKHRLKDFLRDLQPFTLWFLFIYTTGTSNDAFDSFIIEDVDAVFMINMIATKMTKILFRRFH